jgi:hypothetical protein
LYLSGQCLLPYELWKELLALRSEVALTRFAGQVDYAA